MQVRRLIHLGALEGAVAVVPPAEAHEAADKAALRRWVQAALLPGVTAIDLSAAFPWGTAGFEAALMELAAHERTARYARWMVHPWGAKPPSLDCWVVSDASILTRAPKSPVEFARELDEIAPVLSATELVLIDPHPGCLSGAHLDELLPRTPAEHGWIYARRGTPTWDAALRAVERTAMSWGLREHHGG